MSEKIKSQHLGRKALLYVRQSSFYQVNHNLESQKPQYAMQERMRMLGWQEIEIVDEDLGCSAAGTEIRSGFERMVAQVCMGKVGAVAAREVSRFARNSREWQQLVEVCRVVDTLLVDQETIYDCASPKTRRSSRQSCVTRNRSLLVLGNAHVHLGLKSFLTTPIFAVIWRVHQRFWIVPRRSPSDSGGATLVTMVQTADLRHLDDTSCFQCLNRSRVWRILLQG